MSVFRKVGLTDGHDYEYEHEYDYGLAPCGSFDFLFERPAWREPVIVLVVVGVLVLVR